MGRRSGAGLSAQKGSHGQPTLWVLGAVAAGVLACLWLPRDAALDSLDEDYGDQESGDGYKLEAVRSALLSSEGGSHFAGQKEARARKNGFADSSYWDKRYAATKKDADKRFDWYATWSSESKLQMKPYVLPQMPEKVSRVLHVGCGNSRLAEELSEDGFADIVNIDISAEAIEAMSRTSARPGMVFMKMDAMNMTFPSESFDVVLEKGTLDALYTGSADFARKTVGEVFRILRPGGLFVSMTFGAPSSRKELNATGGEGPAANGWGRFDTVVLDEDGVEQRSAVTGSRAAMASGEGSFFIYMMTKPG